MKAILRFILGSALISLFVFTDCFSQFDFVHITDMHVSDGNSYVNNSDINGVVFNEMLTTIRGLTPKPAFVVASGDLTNIGSSGDGAFPVFTQYLYPSPLVNPSPGNYFVDSEQTIPIYFTPGNHEYYTTLIPPIPTPGLANYINYISPDIDYAVVHDNALLLFVRSGYDTFRPLWIDSNIGNVEGSGLSDEQCTWVRNMLNAYPGYKKIIIMHHPPVDVNGTNADGTPNSGAALDAADGSIINDRDIFLNILDSLDVDITLSGHVHQNAVADSAGNVISENWTGGTRFIQTAAALYGGYRIITVDSSFVNVSLPKILSPAAISDYLIVPGSLISYYNHSDRTITLACNDFSNQSNTEVNIYNIAGQRVLTHEVNAKDQSFFVLNAANLQDGFYLLTIQSGNKSITRKLAIN